MRLLFLSASGRAGGAEASLLEILASLHDAQPSWELCLTMAGAGPLQSRAAALGVQTDVLPFPAALARLGESGARGRLGVLAQLATVAGPAAGYVKQLGGRIRAVAPDVVHTNGLKMHVLAARVPARPPLIWHLHDYIGSRPVSARLLRWNRGRCSAVLVPSQSVASDARAVLEGLDVVTVHNAVDLLRFSPCGERADLDALAGMDAPPSGTVRIGLLATFARWKGHATFLTAIARLPRQPPVRAYVIGDAVYETEGSQVSRDELASLALRLGIGDRVGFTGLVQAPEAAVRALDIVVHASTSPEPFGLVIAEAMACARPVIVSLAGGAREIVTPPVDALAHTPGDAAELAARMSELVGDPALRARLGAAGRATAERRFDRKRLAHDLVPIYETIAGVRTEPPASARRSTDDGRLAD